MGLDQLKQSLELKARYHTPKGEATSRQITLKPAKKPLMERYRRQKINSYLEELKNLVLSALNKEVSLYNKMEKADILDMTVKYIKAVRPTTPESPTTEYRQRYEQSETTRRGYQVGRTSPLCVESSNINYNNLHLSSQVLTKEIKKENCSNTINDTYCAKVERIFNGMKQKQPELHQTFLIQPQKNTSKMNYITRTFDQTQNLQQIYHESQENGLNGTFGTQNENCNPSVETTTIWRPW